MEQVLTAHFWSSDRILLAVIFLIGIAIGGLLTNQYVDPYLNSSKNADYNVLVQQNLRLDMRNDLLFSCLQKNNINPENCTIENGASASDANSDGLS